MLPSWLNTMLVSGMCASKSLHPCIPSRVIAKQKQLLSGRLNHITWRYSGGELPPLPTKEDEQSKRGREVLKSQFPPPVTDESIWKPLFEQTVRTLSQFDLVLPTEYMTKNEGREALRELLGWEQYDFSQRKRRDSVEGERTTNYALTAGQVKNSNARDYLGEDEYRALWEANWLDNIIVEWSRAVLLTRLHCKKIDGMRQR